MKLLEKLETLVEELTGLAQEERARRNRNPYGLPFDITCGPNLYGPRGTEISFDHKDHQG